MPPRKKADPKPDPDAPMTPAELAAAINVRFPGSVKMGSHPDLQVKRWSTGELPFDVLLDGGIPRGRFIEVYGPYSTMKSYFLYKALGAVQRAGGKVALIDTEHSFDPVWARQLGLDPDNMLYSTPKDAEEAMGVIEIIIRQRYDLFGFDSIAAAVPRQHAEVAPGEDTQPGALARVMSKGLARLMAANVHTAGIFVNQTRSKIGVSFGSPVTTSGGAAMGFYASYRMSFVRTGKITETVKAWDGTQMADTKRVVAHKIAVTLEKSKLSAPHQDVWFLYDLRAGQIDSTDFLVGQGIAKSLIARTNTGHYTIPGVRDKSIHGADAFRKFLDDNEEVVEWLQEELVGPPTTD